MVRELVTSQPATDALKAHSADRGDTAADSAVVLDRLVQTLAEVGVVRLQPPIRFRISLTVGSVLLKARQGCVRLVPNTDPTSQVLD